MNQFYISGFLGMILLPLMANATHIFGAEITATVESCQSNSYEITISVYEDVNSEVEFGNGILHLGFGDPIDLSTENGFVRKEIVIDENHSLRVSELLISDISFPGPGEYTVYFQEFNRSADVVNIRNSVNTALYTESKLFIDPLFCNSTPQLSDTANYFAYTGSTFLQQLQASDPDDDSLSLELVVPSQAPDQPVSYLGSPLDIDLRYADNPTNAEGTGEPTLTINSRELRWNAPNLPGAFAMAVRVNEWRQVDGQWQSLGYITRDLTVQVLDTVNNLSHTDIILANDPEPEKPKVQLFPNPTQGEFTLEINDDTWLGATASIHNIIGQEMDQRKVSLGENAYNITDYQQGIYFLTLRQGELQNVLRFVKR